MTVSSVTELDASAKQSQETVKSILEEKGRRTK